ncbi:MAG: tRNA (uracil-5-)-methyltransferase [Anaerovoracaceae bacterium]
MNHVGKKIGLILLVLLLVAGGVVLGLNWNKWFGTGVNTDENAQPWSGEEGTYTGEKNTDTIDIPGFDMMTFKAGTKEQAVNLYNPEKNTCYFKFSLYLPDGTKVWQSGLVEPGKGFHQISLTQELAAGEYKDAVLKYECFTMDKEQTPLNGSEIKLTINVLN